MSDQIPLEELASLPSLHHPRVSPDGEHVVCFYDGSGRNELCLLDPETGDLDQISDGEVPREARYPIEWAPDGDAVYYHQDDDGDEQNNIHAFDLDTGETRVVVENDGQTVLQDVSPDGRFLLYATDAGEQLNLHEFDRGRDEHRQATAYERPVFGAMYDPAAERIAYVANERDDLENRDVYVADLPRDGDRDGGATPVGGDGVDGTARRLDVNGEGYQAGITDWTPGGDALLVTDDELNFSRWGIYDLTTDEVEWVSDATCDEWAYCVHPEGYILAGRHDDATQPLVVYDRDGEQLAEPFTEGVAWVHGDRRSGVLADGRILAGQTTPTSRDDLLAYDLAADETTVIREAEYGDIDPDVFVDADYVTYESTDGTEIGAVLYDSGQRSSPVIVLAHGGPHGHVNHTFNARMQFLIDRGYTVLAPNFRGSTAYGREFKNAIHGDWGGKEQDDIAAGARWIAEKEWVDEENLAVFGGSFGGYSAYWQLVRYPDLWDAGIAWVGITDLLSLFEDSMAHFKTILREQMGDPEENADLWRERSPITHVENIEAPLLMLHGVNDPRCPVSQARDFRDALEDRRGWTEGEEFEYVELGEEGHASTDIDHKIRVYRELADFLDERFPAE